MICLSSVLNSVRKNRDFVSREHEKRLPKIRIGVQIFLPKSTNSTLDFVGCEISFISSDELGKSTENNTEIILQQ